MSENAREMSDEVVVHDERAASRYEAEVGDALAGFLDYRDEGERVVLVHTEVDDEFEGRGVGSRLAAYALHDAEASGREVVVECEFVQAYLKRHPELQHLARS